MFIANADLLYLTKWPLLLLVLENGMVVQKTQTFSEVLCEICIHITYTKLERAPDH